ncbi:DEKNAAC105014 [Brettanomyces naardenensis]|uniref:DEKNAAC105014 n=1 Tax=Brettanomyces naardenensis TaxID=13370 RepID=A0A448YSD3_BRENA|nr:DEKNAAC105014 [Brettanomyces naardenensis]
MGDFIYAPPPPPPSSGDRPRNGWRGTGRKRSGVWPDQADEKRHKVGQVRDIHNDDVDDDDDDSYSPPPGSPSNSKSSEIELFPGMSIDLTGGKEKKLLGVDEAREEDRNVARREPTRQSSTIYPDSDEEVDLGEKIVSIQGTNIVLESEEDIQKWIEERRKKWPTEKRIREREKQKEKEQKIMTRLSGRSDQTVESGSVRVCKFWQSTGRCRNGSKCKFLHGAKGAKNGNSGSQFVRHLPHHKVKIIHGVPVQIPQRFSPMVNKGKSLNSLLLESEHLKDENLTLLDVFEKLVKSGVVDSDWEALKHSLKLDDKFT